MGGPRRRRLPCGGAPLSRPPGSPARQVRGGRGRRPPRLRTARIAAVPGDSPPGREAPRQGADRRFGSLAEVLGAERARLLEDRGSGRASSPIKLVEPPAAASPGAIRERDVLASWSALTEYLRATMAFAPREEFRILFLDSATISSPTRFRGGHGGPHPRPIPARSRGGRSNSRRRRSSSRHNHPSGDPKPSAADVSMTREIVSVLAPLNIVVHDHVIMARNGHASLKGSSSRS